jgi:hypothetical protein
VHTVQNDNNISPEFNKPSSASNNRFSQQGSRLICNNVVIDLIVRSGFGLLSCHFPGKAQTAYYFFFFFNCILSDSISCLWGGTWPSGQRGARASRRSQVGIPALATFRSDLLLTGRGGST